jgi:hypothetical protein
MVGNIMAGRIELSIMASIFVNVVLQLLLLAMLMALLFVHRTVFALVYV